MNAPTSTASSDEPVCIELEFVRAQEAEDAFAFRFTRQKYLVRSRQGAYETAEMPWNRELLRDLDEIRDPDRDPATVASVGSLLREFLEPAGWGGHEAAIVEARSARRRVHLTIRSAAAELYALPWELLTLRADGQHLGALDHVLLRYAWPGTSTVEASARATEGLGRLLVVWSAAGGGVPAAEQTKAIEAAVDKAGQGEVDVVSNASYGAIADRLDAADAEGRPFRAMHLLCHGAVAGSTFGLSFDAEGDDGRPVVVDPGRLQQLLAPYAHDLRLVVVSACDGGNMGEPGNRIGSVAQRLHRAGIQSVVASRYPLSSRGSTRMTTALYAGLWRGDPIERAFVDARSAASREVTQLDWASLQLYARPEDGDASLLLVPPVAAPAVEALVSTSAGPAAPERKGGTSIGLIIAVVLLLLGGAAGALSLLMSDDPTESAAGPAPTPEAPVVATTASEPAKPTPAAESGSTGGGSGEPDETSSTGSAAGTTGGETGEAADAGADSTGAPANTPRSRRPRRPVKTEPEPEAVVVTTGRPGARCPGDLSEMVGDKLKSPDQGRYSVEVWVREDGSSKLGSCKDCGDAKKTASGRLSGLKKSRIVSNWSDKLPCRVKVEWQ
ncbi:MAG: CHAT domain-containing protein [Myxococcota bacterium]